MGAPYIYIYDISSLRVNQALLGCSRYTTDIKPELQNLNCVEPALSVSLSGFASAFVYYSRFYHSSIVNLISQRPSVTTCHLRAYFKIVWKFCRPNPVRHSSPLG